MKIKIKWENKIKEKITRKLRGKSKKLQKNKNRLINILIIRKTKKMNFMKVKKLKE